MHAATADAALQQIRADVNRRKIFDKIFVMVGLLIMFSALLVLVVLFIDLVQDGAPRLNWDFLTSFPSRKAERAGILSAWVGTSLIMLTTAAVSMPVGVAAAIYLEEYAPKNWVTAIIEINVTNLAGVPSIIYGLLALGLFVYQFNLGQSIAGGGAHALAADPADRDRRDARGAARRAARHPRGGLCARRDPLGGHGAPRAAVFDRRHPDRHDHRPVARDRRDRAARSRSARLSFIAFLPESPFKGEFPFFSFGWLKEGFTAMPIQMFNWVSRPDPAFQVNAAAAGAILLGMTLLMNGVAIYVRYRFRKRINW